MGKEDETSLSRLGADRRRYIKAGIGLLVTVAAGQSLNLRTRSQNQPLSAPPELQGIIPNCHHLPYINEELRESFINNIQTCGASCTRVFLDDHYGQFEATLGEYRYQPVDKIIGLSKRIPLVVDLFDAFYLLHADYGNPGFTRSRLDSPYLIAKSGRNISEQQMAIFTDKEIRGAFMERLKVASSMFKSVSGIKALSIANELNISMRDMNSARKVHSDFYEEAVDVIHTAGWSGPIMFGVDDPSLIDEERFVNKQNQIINTVHVYPWTIKRIQSYKLQKRRYLPLICQEVGTPKRDYEVPSADYDIECSRFILSTLWRLSEPDESGNLNSLVSAMGPWRFSAEGDAHHDNYEVVLRDMPYTLRALDEVKESLVV